MDVRCYLCMQKAKEQQGFFRKELMAQVSHLLIIVVSTTMACLLPWRLTALLLASASIISFTIHDLTIYKIMADPAYSGRKSKPMSSSCLDNHHQHLKLQHELHHLPLGDINQWVTESWAVSEANYSEHCSISVQNNQTWSAASKGTVQWLHTRFSLTLHCQLLSKLDEDDEWYRYYQEINTLSRTDKAFRSSCVELTSRNNKSSRYDSVRCGL